MIGFYDYTVILTYLSLLSAVTGIGLAVARHPLLAILCLMFSGLCDMFDGRVARTKKNRTAEQKGFGIQIDSLCDIVAFGILPAVITIVVCGSVWYAVLIAALYVLAGLIRMPRSLTPAICCSSGRAALRRRACRPRAGWAGACSTVRSRRRTSWPSARAARRSWTESRWACTAQRKSCITPWSCAARILAAGWSGTRTTRAGTARATARALTCRAAA